MFALAEPVRCPSTKGRGRVDKAAKPTVYPWGRWWTGQADRHSGGWQGVLYALHTPCLSRKPESQEGPQSQESSREHWSHGKRTGQGRLPSSQPASSSWASPASASGYLLVRAWEQSPAAPRGGWGDGEAGTAGPRPLLQKGKLRPIRELAEANLPYNKAWARVGTGPKQGSGGEGGSHCTGIGPGCSPPLNPNLGLPSSLPTGRLPSLSPGPTGKGGVFHLPVPGISVGMEGQSSSSPTGIMPPGPDHALQRRDHHPHSAD